MGGKQKQPSTAIIEITDHSLLISMQISDVLLKNNFQSSYNISKQHRMFSSLSKEEMPKKYELSTKPPH